MKVLFALDSFKGSISSSHAIELLQKTTQKHFPGCEMVSVPIGDGGEGTMDAIIQVLGGRYEHCFVTGPLGKKVKAYYGVLDENTVIIEMAQSSGLTLLKNEELNPMQASSIGTGELLRCVLEKGFINIYLMIGGSATNDGGIGVAAALGIHFLDEGGNIVTPNGAGLCKVASIDKSECLNQLRKANIVVLCDVKNPLLGENGATYVYGKQKGATPAMQQKLEEGMKNYVDVLEESCGCSLREMPGSGAAGGLTISLMAFCNVKITLGIETVLSLINFDKLLEGVDLVVTGEGRLDSQSAQGKALSGLGKVCKSKGIPAVAVVGSKGPGASDIYEVGINAAISCVDRIMSLDEAINKADEYFISAVDQMYRFIKLGMELNRRDNKKLEEGIK